MTKKHFIALADAIREHNNLAVKYDGAKPFDNHHIARLGDFCYSQNSAFNRERWEGYIAGTNGKNGGAIKQTKDVDPPDDGPDGFELPDGSETWQGSEQIKY